VILYVIKFGAFMTETGKINNKLIKRGMEWKIHQKGRRRQWKNRNVLGQSDQGGGNG
jgi:hypothetical protein